MKRHDIGARGETAAAEFLKKNGYRILARNRRESHNELDIVAANREFLIFVEVKTRSVESDGYSRYGPPSSAVTRTKQAHLLAAASQFIREHPKYHSLQPRMDVLEVYVDKYSEMILHIHHIENAFGRY